MTVSDTACCSDLRTLVSPKLFKALADPNRVAILARLAEACGPMTVSEIATCCPVDLSVVSRHVRMLRDAGIVAAEKRGKQLYCSVQYGALVRTLRAIADAIEACCPEPAGAADTAPLTRCGATSAPHAPTSEGESKP